MSLVVTIVMYIYVSTWSLTARPWKVSFPTAVFQPSFFRGYLELRECTPIFHLEKETHSLVQKIGKQRSPANAEAEKPSGRTTVSKIWLKLSPKDKYFRPHCLAGPKRVWKKWQKMKVATYTESADSKKLWNILANWDMKCLKIDLLDRHLEVKRSECIHLHRQSPESTRPYTTSNLQNLIIQSLRWRDGMPKCILKT